jgi:hypothetical protein
VLYCFSHILKAVFCCYCCCCYQCIYDTIWTSYSNYTSAKTFIVLLNNTQIMLHNRTLEKKTWKGNRLYFTIYSIFFCFCFFFVGEEDFTLAKHVRCPMTWATSLAYFALVILEMGFSRTIFLGWPQTTILPTTATQVARIIGVSHWLPVHMVF